MEPIITAQTSYHHKKRLIMIVAIAAAVIIIGILGWILWKKYYPSQQNPAKALVSLAASSQPVQKSADERLSDMKAIEGTQQSRQVTKATVADRLQMFDSLNKK